VFRLHDDASGQASEVRPLRPGVLRIWVAGGDATRPGGLRRCLVADVLRRVAERHHLRASVWHEFGDDEALRLAWSGLNIYPAEFAASAPHPPDVAIVQAKNSSSATSTLRPASAEAASGSGLDPLALRLALLEHLYREPVVLPRATLEAADQTLRHWRALVARWAHSPSKPMCAQYVGDVYGALDDDLGTPAVLRTMHALAADTELPPGSRFEAFAHLDQLLGLDLARDVGR
jgi:cysteinyl-tRNA synthetase